MKSIVIDQGNTWCKVAVMNGAEVVCSTTSREIDHQAVARMVEEHKPRYGAVCSTRGDGQMLTEVLSRYVADVLHVTAAVPLPVGVEYGTPQTLGADRLAAAVGAQRLYGDDVVIIDMGTAITIDVVEGGVFRGGNISPGVAMRFRALHDYTALLPLCSASEEAWMSGVGDSTVHAIERGVVQGVIHEIEGYVALFGREKPKIRIIFCGGDAKNFVNRIKNAIFADCNLTLIGLTTILEYNVAQGNI